MLKVLHVSDSHIGFDPPPLRPRRQRRRRHYDFVANHERALRRAVELDVDLVVHSGDLFHRSKPRADVIESAYAPLLAVADAGIPVVVVPGNHERSRLPMPLCLVHPKIEVLREPRTVVLERRGIRVAVGGSAFVRDCRDGFCDRLDESGLLGTSADVRLLVIHEAVEGATVGPQNFVFHRRADTIAGSDIPEGVAAVLAGHIHRHQVITHELVGRPLAAPVIYAGSVERTAMAERGETKGFVELGFAGEGDGGRLSHLRFEPLPARPMHLVEIDGSGLFDVRGAVEAAIRQLPEDAVVDVRVKNLGAEPWAKIPTIDAPAGMNLRVVADARAGQRRSSARAAGS